MHISPSFQHRPDFSPIHGAALAGALAARESSRADAAWQVPSSPPYAGGRIVARSERTWSSLCAVVLDVRAEGEIRAPIQADFTRVCMTLEEVGGVFDVSGPNRPANRPAPVRRAVSVIPPGMRAEGQATTLRYMRQLMLQLDSATLSAWLEERVDVETALAPRLMLAEPRLLQLGQLIAKECTSGQPTDELYCDGLVVAILGALANLRGGISVRRDICGGLAPWQVRRVTDYLHEHLSETVNMSVLAGVAGLSKAHFSRAFKVSTGMPPHRWLLDARIGKARQLLIESDLPLAEISLTVGFADQAHFTRTFGSIVGTSPRAWQRARRR